MILSLFFFLNLKEIIHTFLFEITEAVTMIDLLLLYYYIILNTQEML